MTSSRIKQRRRPLFRRRGASLIVALVTLLVITMLTAAIVQSLVTRLRQSRASAAELQAAWLAEAGLARAAAQVRANPSYEGETWQAVAAAPNDAANTGVVEIRVVRPAVGNMQLQVQARYPDDPVRRVIASRKLEITNLRTKANAGGRPQETAP